MKLDRNNSEVKIHINCIGDSKDKSAVSWEMKSKIAIKIAEALTYLHSECSPPVIHRDVKSSNILLSDELEPQVFHQTKYVLQALMSVAEL